MSHSYLFQAVTVTNKRIVIVLATVVLLTPGLPKAATIDVSLAPPEFTAFTGQALCCSGGGVGGGIFVGSSQQTSNFVWGPSSNQNGSASASAGPGSGKFSPFTSTAATGTDTIATASATYSFAVIGPQNVNVPILAFGKLSASVAFPAEFPSLTGAVADISVSGTGGSQFDRNVRANASTVTNDSFSGFLGKVFVDSDSASGPGFVSMGTVAEVNVGASAGASIDPFLIIDPSFAGADQFKLIFSDGINNVPETAISSVPLPQSVLLFLTAVLSLMVFSWIAKSTVPRQKRLDR